MEAAFDAQLYADGKEFTADDAALLSTIDSEGSLNQATDTLNRSYSRAHQRLNELENAFGPLVERHRGGATGGGSTLTQNGQELLSRFERVHQSFLNVSEIAKTTLEGTVIDRQGEIGTIETEAGTIQALISEPCKTVTVSIRADTVTLHPSDQIPKTRDSSAQNKFIGTITDINMGESVALVSVDIGVDTALQAILTEASLQRLDITRGEQVGVTFKATATQATPR
ncbi:MAG: TOBE domain-containing protein [Halobacteriaceae archaeon]